MDTWMIGEVLTQSEDFVNTRKNITASLLNTLCTHREHNVCIQ